MSDHSDSDRMSIDDEAQDALDQLAPIDRMIVDVERGITIIIGFAGRVTETIVDDLTTFISNHPEFAFLIKPILDYDPEYASAGEITFHYYCSSKAVQARLDLSPMFKGQKKEAHEFQMSLESLKTFVRLTEPFGCFMTNNGDDPLNF